MLRVPTKPTSPTEMHRLSNTVGELDKKSNRGGTPGPKGQQKVRVCALPAQGSIYERREVNKWARKKTKQKQMKNLSQLLFHILI